MFRNVCLKLFVILYRVIRKFLCASFVFFNSFFIFLFFTIFTFTSEIFFSAVLTAASAPLKTIAATCALVNTAVAVPSLSACLTAFLISLPADFVTPLSVFVTPLLLLTARFFVLKRFIGVAVSLSFLLTADLISLTVFMPSPILEILTVLSSVFLRRRY